MFTVARPAGGVSCVKLAARQATAESRTTLGLSQPPGASVRAPWRTRTEQSARSPVTASVAPHGTPAASLLLFVKSRASSCPAHVTDHLLSRPCGARRRCYE